MPLGDQVRLSHAIVAATPGAAASESGIIVVNWDGIGTPSHDETVPGISSYSLSGEHTVDIGSPNLAFVVASVAIIKEPENFGVQEYSRTAYKPGLSVSYTDAAGTTLRYVHQDLIFNNSDDSFSETRRSFSGCYGFTPSGPTTVTVAFNVGFGTGPTHTSLRPSYWHGTTAIYVSY